MDEGEIPQGSMPPSELGLTGLPMTDNPTELTKFIVDPEARKRYDHITKDMAVSNLDRAEIEWININLRLLHMISYVEENEKDLDPIRNVILQDVFSFLQVLRSKGGFERKAEISKVMKSFHEQEDKTKKRGLW